MESPDPSRRSHRLRCSAVTADLNSPHASPSSNVPSFTRLLCPFPACHAPPPFACPRSVLQILRFHHPPWPSFKPRIIGPTSPCFPCHDVCASGIDQSRDTTFDPFVSFLQRPLRLVLRTRDIKMAMPRGSVPKGCVSLPRELKPKAKNKVFVSAEGKATEEAKRAGWRSRLGVE
jgi:hypothetical protein